MRYGVVTDRLVGAMSRFLHFRRAKHNTATDLDPYLELEPTQMFPPPGPVDDFSVGRTFIDRLARSSTVRWTSRHRVLCPKYRFRHHGAYQRNLRNQIRWVRPDGKRRKSALIYVHGWLESGSWAEETTLFRKWGRELDADLVHVSLPFHGPRKPPSSLFSGEFFWTADLVRTVEAVRQAVFDVRQTVSWLRAQGYQQVGITGISLGGAVTMITACLTPGPDFVIPIVAHLQLGEAVEQAPILGRMRRDLERWGMGQASRRQLFERIGWHAYQPVLSAANQLWIAARDDVYIDAELARAQWQQWGQPSILWIDGGHMTFPLHMGVITNAMASFMRLRSP